MKAQQFANRRNRFENEMCSVEYVVATPAIVNRLLDGNLRNRRLNAGHMKRLTMDFKNGKFVFNGQPIIRDADGYLRDGQHRLMAIKEAGYPAVPLILVTLKGDQSHIELAYDRMDLNKTRTYAQRLEHKGLDYSQKIAAIRRKITYLKTNFGQFPVVSDSIYDEIGQLYCYEIEKVAPLVGAGFTADMAVAVCLVGKVSGCIDDCVNMVKRAKAMEGLVNGTPEFTLMKIFTKTIRGTSKGQGHNAFCFAIVAHALIAGLSGKKYPVINTSAASACKWIMDMAKENEIIVLPKSMNDC